MLRRWRTVRDLDAPDGSSTSSRTIPSTEVVSSDVTHIDAVVVPASADVARSPAGTTTELVQALRPHLPAGATLLPLDSATIASDLEVSMRVDASAAQIDAMRRRAGVDPDVRAYAFVDRDEAYRILSSDFADQPALIQATKPADLPESFRVDMRRGAPVELIAQRYRVLDGVDTVITAGPLTEALFTQPSGTQPPICRSKS